MKIARLKCVFLAALSGAMLVTASVALAQIAEPATSGALDEIIVTAEKRSENLQKVPETVQAISAETLEQANISTVAELPSLTTGLQVVHLGNTASPYIRGVGTGFSFPGLESSVAVYIDDVYAPRTGSGFLELSDINHIEVLKGPQGTLFGRNSSGGAIRVVTNDPTNEFGGWAAVTYGRFNERRFDGVVNLPINDKISSRFSVTELQNDGYITDPYLTHNLEDKNDYRLDGKLLATVTDRFTVKVGASYFSESDYSGFAVPNLSGGASGLQQNGVALGGTPSPSFYVSTQNYPESAKREIKNAAFTVRADYELDHAILSSKSSYNDFYISAGSDIDGTNLSDSNALTSGPTRTFSEELTAVSRGDGPLDWTAGLYMDGERSTSLYTIWGPFLLPPALQPPFLSPGSPNIQSPLDVPLPYIFTRRTYEGSSIAPFVQATYHFTSKWAITAGARYTSEHKKVPYHVAQLLNVPGSPTLVDETNSRTFTKFTPKVGLEFDPVDGTMLYATYSVGYKSGGFNIGVTGPDDILRPEVLTSYEVGVKTEVGRFRFDGSAFYYNFKDQQISLTDPVTGALYAQNAAGSHEYGLDTELNYKATDRLDVNLAVLLMHSEFTNYPGDNLTPNDSSAACLGAVGGVLPSPGPTVPAACIGFSNVPASFRGQALPLTPAVSGNVRLNYRPPVPSAFGIVNLFSIVTYTGTFDWGPTGSYPYPREHAHELLSAGAKWSPASGRYDFSVSGDNLTNVKYNYSVIRVTSGGAYTPAPPLWWHLRFAVHF